MNLLKENVTILQKEINKLSNFSTKLKKIANNYEIYFNIANNLYKDLNNQNYN